MNRHRCPCEHVEGAGRASISARNFADALRLLGFSWQNVYAMIELGAIDNGTLNLVAQLRCRMTRRWPNCSNCEVWVDGPLSMCSLWPRSMARISGRRRRARNILTRWLGLGEELDYESVRRVLAYKWIDLIQSSYVVAIATGCPH